MERLIEMLEDLNPDVDFATEDKLIDGGDVYKRQGCNDAGNFGCGGLHRDTETFLCACSLSYGEIERE